MSSSFVAKTVQDYLNVFSFSNGFGKGWIRVQPGPSGNLNQVTVLRSVRGLDEDRQRSFLDTFLSPLPSSSPNLDALNRMSSTTLDSLSSSASPVVYDISPSGRKTISLRHNSCPKEGIKPYIEFSGEQDDDSFSSGDSFRIDVSSMHGKIIGDAWFGGISWSPDERFVAYVAMNKEAKKATFFDKDHTAAVGEDNKYSYKEDWGEKYVGVCDLSIFVVDLSTQSVNRVTTAAEAVKWTVGQPCFLPTNTLTEESGRNGKNEYQLVYTAWKNNPRKLGMIYCYQRPSKIFLVNVSTLLQFDPSSVESPSSDPALLEPKLLSGDIKSARSPRCSPDGKFIVFVGHRKGFKSHGGCSELFMVDVNLMQTNERLDSEMGEMMRRIKEMEAGAKPPDTQAPLLQTLAEEKSADDDKALADVLNQSHVQMMSFDPPTMVPDVKLSVSNSTPATEANDIPAATVTAETVVAEVWHPSASPSMSESPPGFPGLYLDQLPRQCFLQDNSTVVLSSLWGSRETVLYVSLLSGKVLKPNLDSTVLESKTSTGASVREAFFAGASGITMSVLDVSKDNSILFTASSPVCAPRLGVYDCTSRRLISLTQMPFTSSIKMKVAEPPKETSQSSTRTRIAPKTNPLGGLQFRVFKHETEKIPFESFLLFPTHVGSSTGNDGEGSIPAVKSLPLVVVPHGGPHSCTPQSFVPSYAYLAQTLGAAILHVNYRGSTGFGQDSIASLLGTIGTNDVADMMTATSHCKTLKYSDLFNDDSVTPVSDGFDVSAKYSTAPLVDTDRICVVGGSHGGFLAGHLIGQHPETFKVACMRNPVTNIAAMVGVSDIPDWCFVEALGEDFYDFDKCKTPSDKELAVMRQRSPIAHLERVTAPTLICLGKMDRRVPFSQGVDFHHLLKARGVETKLTMYSEDVHAIDKPASEADHWVSIAEWIHRHLK